eukprot:gnl/MRDRNA2_/MRDRNA2_83467_c0_seq3.p1 gnl/MRDRNA2_/MRDRNA2_83467_c0~~gnl/MRDRNA2_/MRDRNA2_83467_c0_seq3.p1  ORF type:complete len:417 (+),score=102.17 gnl/MRDRNA2_/MRDRNA2_83467_c0_seq3:83-1252(+)
MPGFIENTVYQGYGYLDQNGYIGMAVPYVEKVRNTVPLADKAAKLAEERVPPLISKVDELAEPTIEKMRPYVEPKVEQVKETVTPYVNKGVEKYEQIKDFTETKTTQIKSFKDRQVHMVKDFTDVKTAQLKKITDPQVTKIKNVVEPHLTAGKIQGQKLLRVAGCADLQDLKCETVLGKIAATLSKAESLLDKYLPVPEQPDSGSDTSNESDSSYTKINKSAHGIKNHLLLALVIKVKVLLSLPKVLKTSYADGSMKETAVSFYTKTKGTVIAKVEYAKAEVKTFINDPKKAAAPVLEHFKGKLALVKSKANKLMTQVSDKFAPIPVKLAPTVAKVAKNPHFMKAVQVAVTSTEKVIGKDKTVAIVQKIEACIPSAWKTAPKKEVKKSK